MLSRACRKLSCSIIGMKTKRYYNLKLKVVFIQSGWKWVPAQLYIISKNTGLILHHEEKREGKKKYNTWDFAPITGPVHDRDWKKPLETIHFKSPSQSRVSWDRLLTATSSCGWIMSKMETPKYLWATCSNLWLL